MLRAWIVSIGKGIVKIMLTLCSSVRMQKTPRILTYTYKHLLNDNTLGIGYF